MREALKRLTGESLVYGLGQVSGRAVQLLLVPVLTRALLPGQYGVSETLIAYSQTAVLVLVLGMDAALARFFYQEPDREARVRMVSSSLALRLAVGAAAAVLLALLAGPLSARMLGSEVYRKYFLMSAATLPFTLVVLFSNDVLRVTFQPWKFIALNLAQTIFVGGLALHLVLARHLGVAGVLYARLGGDAATALLGLILIRLNLRPSFSRETLERMLRYGLPLVPVSIAYGLITSIDRYLLQKTCSLAEAGVYALAMKFFAVVTMGVSAFQLGFFPFAFARAQTPEAPRLYARVFMAYMAVASFGALLAGLFAPEVLRVAAPASYRGAASPALWLSFAAVAQGAYYVSVLGISLSLRTPLLGWTAGGAALVAVAANVALTPRYGAGGAAAATCLAYTASAVFTYAVAQRVHPLPHRGARLAGLFGAALGLGLLARSLPLGGASGIAVKLGAALLFVTLVVRMDALRERGAVAAPH